VKIKGSEKEARLKKSHPTLEAPLYNSIKSRTAGKKASAKPTHRSGRIAGSKTIWKVNISLGILEEKNGKGKLSPKE